jgi:hypothetical protein
LFILSFEFCDKKKSKPEPQRERSPHQHREREEEGEKVERNRKWGKGGLLLIYHTPHTPATTSHPL